MGHVIGPQTRGDEVSRATFNERTIPTGLPTTLQPKRRPKPVKVEGHNNATRIGIVGQHVTHRRRIAIGAIGEGHHDVVR